MARSLRDSVSSFARHVTRFRVSAGHVLLHIDGSVVLERCGRVDWEGTVAIEGLRPLHRHR